MARIALFVGSVRKDRHGIKVGWWMNSKLLQRGHHVYFIDPLELQLPMLDRMYKEMTEPPERLKDLREKIKNADGFMPISPEYNHSTSSVLKNTIDYFLEEYFFKPSAIVSYSVGPFGGINAAQHLRQIFAELGAPSISSSLQIPRVQEVFDNDGNLLVTDYDKKANRFLDEFEWYMEALSNQRKKGTPY
jgi:NAD(P)H-dependent FMN reductase